MSGIILPPARSTPTNKARPGAVLVHMNGIDTLKAILIGVVAIGASGCGEENSGLKSPASNPRATPPAASTTTGPGTVVRVGGRSYRCTRSAAADIEIAADRVQEAKSENRPLARRLKRIASRYRGQSPPADVAAEYNALLRRHKAEVRTINKLIRAHNRALDEKCSER